MENYYESDSDSISSFESENLRGRGRRGRPRKGKGATGASLAGAGFLSDLGIPIVSQLAGAVGLGKRGKRKGRGATGAAMTGAAMTGAGATGAGFLSDLGIPILSPLAGAVGLGAPYHYPYHGGAMTGAAYGRTRPRAPSAQMLHDKFQMAKFRAEQMPNMGIKKGGYVHRPAHYRGVGAGATGAAMTGAGEYADDYMGGAFTGGMTRKLLGRPVGAGRRKMKGRGEESESDEEYEGGRMRRYKARGATGAGFWDDFKQGFMSVVKPVAGIAKAVAPLAGPEGMALSGALGAVGLGKRGRKSKAKAHDGRKARAEIVKKVMKQRGCSLAEASKIVKAEGLY